MMKVFELLKTGNFQAQVIKNIAPFIKGEDVNIELTHNDMVKVFDMNETKYEEYNLDTREDYDKYFKIY
jgi:hypothetical protein